MGLSVYGCNGNYFRSNVWFWRPLWNYVEIVCVDVLIKEEYENGYTKETAEKIARRLRDLDMAGELDRYEKAYNEFRAMLPDVPCGICGGTGRRAEPPAIGPGELECNGCGGKGTRRPFFTMYPFTAENVREFARFCAESGGFRVY